MHRIKNGVRSSEGSDQFKSMQSVKIGKTLLPAQPKKAALAKKEK